MPIHVVEQGEHLSSIAEKFGFHDFRTIWEDPQNAALREKRKNPHVLMPGDEVFIPDKRLKNEARSTGATHTFKIKGDKLKLKVLIQDVDGEPIEDETVGVLIEGTASREKLPGGMLEKDIKRTDHTGRSVPSLSTAIRFAHSCKEAICAGGSFSSVSRSSPDSPRALLWPRTVCSKRSKTAFSTKPDSTSTSCPHPRRW